MSTNFWVTLALFGGLTAFGSFLLLRSWYAGEPGHRVLARFRDWVRDVSSVWFG